jgi:hypothetical protein
MANPQLFDQQDEHKRAVFAPSVKIYITCRKCGTHNCFEDIPASRVELALFRGSEDRIVKCRACRGAMDTVTAFCGENFGSEIVHRQDPKY